jgi:hypothetical protein
VIAGSKTFRAQVKSSSSHGNGNFSINIKKSDWYRGTSSAYTTEDCDIVFAYDLVEDKSYLFSINDIGGSKSVTLRIDPAENGQVKGIRLAKDYELTAARVQDILGYKCPDISLLFSSRKAKPFDRVCKKCGIEFSSGYHKATYCSKECRPTRRKVERPPMDVLKKQAASMPMTQVGKLYGVSDNAIRKWLKEA